MSRECFPPLGFAFALLMLAPAAAAQESSEVDSGAFEPRFIDAGSYRHDEVLLHDWPELTRLVRSTGAVAEAVARDDGTLTAELLQDFRERVGELSEDPAPSFLAARSDSVRTILGRIASRLDAADSLLASDPPALVVDPTGEELANDSGRERTYATGPTAVRVPAGIDVGDSDSLPGARIEGRAGEPTYIDLVAESLAELDGLVHLVRKIGAPATPDP